MFSVGAKLLYSAILGAIALLCLNEVFRVWFDNTLYIAPFKYIKDGQDQAASGSAFALLLQQQKATLTRLFTPTQVGDPNVFVSPLDVRDIHVGQLDVSGIGDIKIETQGVNITALLEFIRRGVSTPNEISGTVSEVGPTIHVYSSWSTAPSSTGEGNEVRSFALRPAVNLDAASFDLACRILRIELAPKNAALLKVPEDDFCAFVSAWTVFDDLSAAHDDEERKKAMEPRLKQARSALDRLTTSKDPGFAPVWKLAAYFAIAESSLDQAQTPHADELDLAQSRLEKYLKLLEADGKNDASAQDRLEFLKARKAQVKVTVAAQAEGVPILGRSLGSEGDQSVSSACCLVRDESGQTFILTADYALGGGLGASVFSPAPLDGGGTSNPVGVIAKILPRTGLSGGLGLIRVHDASHWKNAFPDGTKLTGLADAHLGQQVRYSGRTSGSGVATISLVQTSLRASGQQMFEGMVAGPVFSKPGDGGGPVADSESRLIGLIYASSSHDSNGLTFVLPLREVLAANKLTLIHD